MLGSICDFLEIGKKLGIIIFVKSISPLQKYQLRRSRLLMPFNFCQMRFFIHSKIY